MKLIELLQQPGLGVMATASKAGFVNTAIYARPHVMDEQTLVWGMTDGRTYRNIADKSGLTSPFKTHRQWTIAGSEPVL